MRVSGTGHVHHVVLLVDAGACIFAVDHVSIGILTHVIVSSM
jgi:hypothetical protein